MIQQIGTIHSPHKELAGMPIQPKGSKGILGTIKVNKDLQSGLTDLDGFSHIYIFYHFHKASRTELTVIPFMDTTPRGVFSTRSPLRPNHIGMSIVELVKIEDNILTVRNIDVLDNTPLLDIKPYIKAFDSVDESTSGWMKAGDNEVIERRSDNRFK